jgi:polar amino acid transport system substrate-binding protein
MPTARSIAGSATAAFAFDAALPIVLPRLDENLRFHVHENCLPSLMGCDHNFILVKIGSERSPARHLSQTFSAHDLPARSRRLVMPFKRILQFALLALSMAASVPASAQQLLKVGSTPTGVPFTFLDTKTNQIQGIMVDLITEVGKDAGFAVQVEPMQFSTLIASLTSNKIDIISAAMFITPARKEVIDFSDPIYTYGEGLIVPKSDTREYQSQQDLKGEVVGAQVGTAFVDALKKSGLFAEVKAYDAIPDILRDVNTGRLKAGFADYPILAYNLKQGSFPDARIVESYKPVVIGSVGIGVRKGDAELLGKINTSLARLKANGTVEKILAKWGLKAQGV